MVIFVQPWGQKLAGAVGTSGIKGAVLGRQGMTSASAGWRDADSDLYRSDGHPFTVSEGTNS